MIFYCANGGNCRSPISWDSLAAAVYMLHIYNPCDQVAIMPRVAVLLYTEYIGGPLEVLM